MGNNGKIKTIKNVLFYVAVTLIGVTAVIFSILYIDTFNTGFFAKYSTLIKSVSISLIAILTVGTILFIGLSKEFIYKLFLLTIIFIALALGILYGLKASGFLDKIDSVEDFRAYVESFGSWAVILFITLQFLQVVVLPIPAFITVGAGVLLFGALKGSIYSCIGIILGSIVAFLIGRHLGYKVVKWLVGEDGLKKGLKAIKGKDKVVLTFMFLFPFFPDDILCFVAGITTVNTGFFVVMIFITRIISVFTSSYSMNGSIIPYNTWWGILLWILFFALTIFITWLLYKKGEKIEKFFTKRFKIKKKEKHGRN